MNNDDSEVIKLEISNRLFQTSESVLTFAQLLVELDSFKNLIKQARKEAGLTALIPYPEDHNYIQVLKIPLKIGLKKYEIVDAKAEEIVRTYNLTGAWIWPVRIAICTGHLQVPYDSAVEIIAPASSKEEKEIRDQQIGALEDSNSLVIVVKRDISLTELKSIVSNPRRGVTKILRRLPKLPSTKSDKATIYWGQIAAILVQEYPDSKYPRSAWSTRLRALNDMNIDFMEKSSYPDTPDELQSYYSRYKRLLSKWDSKRK